MGSGCAVGAIGGYRHSGSGGSGQPDGSCATGSASPTLATGDGAIIEDVVDGMGGDIGGVVDLHAGEGEIRVIADHHPDAAGSTCRARAAIGMHEAAIAASTADTADTAGNVGRDDVFERCAVIEDHPRAASACGTAGAKAGKKFGTVAARAAVAAHDGHAAVSDMAGIHVETRTAIATGTGEGIHKNRVATGSAAAADKRLVKRTAAGEPATVATLAAAACPARTGWSRNG